AQTLAALLNEDGVRVFYDEYVAAELWGSDLYTVLDEVYRKRARFTIVFISKHYVSKPWTRHERQSAQARAMLEVGAYLLPVRLDDSELPGLRPTVAYIDARRTPFEEIAALVKRKLVDSPGTTAQDSPTLRVPRDEGQQRELLAQRPPGWEYLLYAGVLWQRREALESKWCDHQIGYSRRNGRHLDNNEAISLMHHALDDLKVCGPNLEKVLDPVAQERAFGAPGEPGNPALIEHIAARLVSIYDDMLDIAAMLRGTTVPSETAQLMEVTARLTDMPLQQIRDAVDQLVAEIDLIPDKLARGEKIVIELTVAISIDDNVLQELARRQTQQVLEG
ncbi:MAG: hypothetical protein QG597_4677, partial [Actinomycetota bacterium]|nr:hypothetical protein [Actinomycetota bacterium]